MATWELCLQLFSNYFLGAPLNKWTEHPKISEEKLKTSIYSSTFLQIILGVSLDYWIIHPKVFGRKQTTNYYNDPKLTGFRKLHKRKYDELIPVTRSAQWSIIFERSTQYFSRLHTHLRLHGILEILIFRSPHNDRSFLKDRRGISAVYIRTCACMEFWNS
jgi:hypothetical protein